MHKLFTLNEKEIGIIIVHLQISILTVHPDQISSSSDCCATYVIMWNHTKMLKKAKS